MADNKQEVPQRVWIDLKQDRDSRYWQQIVFQGGTPYVPAAAYDKLVKAAEEILNSGVEFDDSRMGYVVMQVDRDALTALRKALGKKSE